MDHRSWQRGLVGEHKIAFSCVWAFHRPKNVDSYDLDLILLFDWLVRRVAWEPQATRETRE